jgi:cytochrome c oxidase subunit 1
MFVSGMNPWLGTAFMATTLIIAVPSAIKTFNWLATLWGANIRFTTAMLFAIGFVSTFVTGGLTGLFLGNPPIDIPLHDTYFVVAHFHMVMGTSALFALYAAVYHWFPKMFGRMMNEKLGKLHFWLTFIGVYAVFFPMHYLGFIGVPRSYYAFDQYEFFPQLARQQHQCFHQHRGFHRRRSAIFFVLNFIWSVSRVRKPTGTRGKLIPLSGKRPPRRRTATGVTNCPTFTVGLTTTASQVHLMTSSPKPSRQHPCRCGAMAKTNDRWRMTNDQWLNNQ